VSGPLADRLGPRIPAIAGMLLVGLGLLVAASAGSLVEIYAGYGLLVGLGTGFAYVPAMVRLAEVGVSGAGWRAARPKHVEHALQ
jgi:MFS family permease